MSERNVQDTECMSVFFRRGIGMINGQRSVDPDFPDKVDVEGIVSRLIACQKGVNGVFEKRREAEKRSRHYFFQFWRKPYEELVEAFPINEYLFDFRESDQPMVFEIVLRVSKRILEILRNSNPDFGWENVASSVQLPDLEGMINRFPLIEQEWQYFIGRGSATQKPGKFKFRFESQINILYTLAAIALEVNSNVRENLEIATVN